MFRVTISVLDPKTTYRFYYFEQPTKDKVLCSLRKAKALDDVISAFEEFEWPESWDFLKSPELGQAIYRLKEENRIPKNRIGYLRITKLKENK
jgi:hypothetical protein